jgi:glycosyltransferase involved in cell wall biosynthesis
MYGLVFARALYSAFLHTHLVRGGSMMLQPTKMRIGIVTPAPPGSRYGNRVTAARWARLLRAIGHGVSVTQAYGGERIDLLIALHARRSFDSIKRFHRDHPDKPLIVALTGTDLYRDLNRGSRALEALKLATRIVALQRKAVDALPPALRKKTRVIYQSVSSTADKAHEAASTGKMSRPASPRTERPATTSEAETFDVCVIGHLRPVKDSFRTAMAARRLPASSRIRVIQVGGAMTAQAEARARAEMNTNARYVWLGEQPAWRVRKILRSSRISVLSSRMEGGANAMGESIVEGTPVLSSRIPGSIGLLGERYAGYFAVGDTNELARLMSLAETDPAFLAKLERHCGRLQPLFDPAKERGAWEDLLDELL